jgi:hypothetical protein
MVSHTQTLEGVTSLQKNKLHTPFFDLENCSLTQVENTLRTIQRDYHLSNIYVTSDKERSFRAWCYSQVKFTSYLRMMLNLLDSGLLDYNFFWWTVKQGKSTLRVSSKTDRPKQKIVSVLESYFVPVPESCEKVVYDTGIEKRGLTVFLGRNGKVIHG